MPVWATPSAPNAWAASSISGSPERRELRERRGATEEVDRHDRLRPGAIRADTSSGSRFSVTGIDVGEDRRRADARDRLGRRVERERRADDLVAAPDPERLENEDERVGAVRNADRVGNTEERRGLVLERLHLWAEDEPPGLEDGGEPLLELRDEWRILRLRVDEWDRLAHAGECSFVGSDPTGLTPSSSGPGGLLGHTSSASLDVPPGEPGGASDDRRRDDVLDVAERVVEVLPRLSRCVAGSRESEAPDRRSRGA